MTRITDAFDTYITTVNSRIDTFIKSFNTTPYQEANKSSRTERRRVSYEYFLLWEWNEKYENVTITEGNVLATKQKVSGLANNINSKISSIVDNLSENKVILANSLKTVFKDAPTDIRDVLFNAVDNIVDTIEHKEFIGVPTVDLSLFNRFGNNAKAEPTALDSVARQTVDNFMAQQKEAISTYQKDWDVYITVIKNDFQKNISSKINDRT